MHPKNNIDPHDAGNSKKRNAKQRRKKKRARRANIPTGWEIRKTCSDFPGLRR